MILNSISLHNFMSYADAQLDLTSVNVACLAGHNGAGKSAILDAVTWALWECARSSSDELIRLGEREMWVEVNFGLEGQLYRVRRCRQKSAGKSGRATSKGTLELQILAGESWRSLTAASMRETQRQITELLRMDYDTFVNSVYLRQGRADEFTTKAPAERKQLLGEILGLSFFDRLQQAARERAGQLRERALLLEPAVGGLPELDRRAGEIEGELAAVGPRCDEAASKVSFYEAGVADLENRLKEMHLAEQMLASGASRAPELEADIAGLRAQEQELLRKLSTLGDLIGRSAQIESSARELSLLRKQVEELDAAALAVQDLNTRRLELSSELAAMRSRLELKLDHLRQTLAERKGKHEQLARDTADREKLEDQYRKLKEMIACEAEMLARQEAYAHLSARADELQSLVQEARIRMEAELEQKTAAQAELAQIAASGGVLAYEQDELHRESEALDRLESEFELVGQQGLKVKSDAESLGMEIKELRRKELEKKEKVKELEGSADSSICPLCSAPIVDRLAVINRYQAEIRSLANQAASLEATLGQLEEERLALRQRYAELKQKLESRKLLDTRIGQLNEKLSSLSRADAGARELAQQIKTLEARLKDQDFAQVERESLVNVKAEIHKLEFDPVIFANLQSQIRSQRHVEGRYQQLKRDLCELKKVEEEIPPLLKQVEELSAQLSAETYGSELRERLSAIQADIRKLDYDRQKHQELKQKLGELIPVSELARDLERARAESPAAEEALNACRASIKTKQEQLTRLVSDLEGRRSLLSGLPQLKSQLAELEPLLSQWRERKAELSERRAVLKARLQELEGERQSLAEKKRELAAVRADLEDFLFLGEAFGKKGIQAVIIENAIPEIESESNRILSRLSDNRMHVALKTQHQKKSGGFVETLDLLIGDELGTRAYELYSGGEAFKVNFAVRVALSRLLARRSGAKLETLIIDEGFGSQDESSRDRLVKVIGSIQGDFARILVITHISEIKEMFPAHIHVCKRDGASRIELLC